MKPMIIMPEYVLFLMFLVAYTIVKFLRARKNSAFWGPTLIQILRHVGVTLVANQPECFSASLCLWPKGLADRFFHNEFCLIYFEGMQETLLPSSKFAFVILHASKCETQSGICCCMRWKLSKSDHNPRKANRSLFDATGVQLMSRTTESWDDNWTLKKKQKQNPNILQLNRTNPRTASGRRLWSHISTGMVVHFGDLELSGVRWARKENHQLQSTRFC